MRQGIGVEVRQNMGSSQHWPPKPPAKGLMFRLTCRLVCSKLWVRFRAQPSPANPVQHRDCLWISPQAHLFPPLALGGAGRLRLLSLLLPTLLLSLALTEAKEGGKCWREAHLKWDDKGSNNARRRQTQTKQKKERKKGRGEPDEKKKKGGIPNSL